MGDRRELERRLHDPDRQIDVVEAQLRDEFGPTVAPEEVRGVVRGWARRLDASARIRDFLAILTYGRSRRHLQQMQRGDREN